MFECCNTYKNFDLYNTQVKDDSIIQAPCIFSDNLCIGKHDVLINTSENNLLFCKELEQFLYDITMESPKIKYIIKDEEKITVSSNHCYYELIIHFFELLGSTEISFNKNSFKINYKGIEVLVFKTFCNIHSQSKNEYSETVLIGKLLSLCDVLKESVHLEIFSYPQFQPMLKGDLKNLYNYGFLHDLAVYICIHEKNIKWDSVFNILYCLEVNQQFLFLFQLFNHLYNLIPNKFIPQFKILKETIPSDAILCIIRENCTYKEIINNDYRCLYNALLTDLNCTKREYFYTKHNEQISFDLNHLRFEVSQHNHNNPYGSSVFHGSEKDDSDNLFFSWGVWEYNEYISFLIKLYNPFFIKSNESKFENCRIEISIAATDDISHKFTEIFVHPFFNEEEQLDFKITDGMENDEKLCENLKYRYIAVGEEFLIALSIKKSYLHIPHEGTFGMDILLSCADNNSLYKHHSFRKTISWTGNEPSWRDIRTYSLMRKRS